MKHFLIYTEDKSGSLDIRKANRDAHLAWLGSDPKVDLISAGPWLDTDGLMAGSLVIVAANSLQTVEDWLENDPYKKAGLTGFLRVREYNWVIGAPG